MPDIVHLDQVPVLEPDQKLALYALARGHATGAQQVTALWIIQAMLCGVAAVPPAKLTEGEAGFLRGKQWVGLMINQFSDVPLYRVTPEE